MYEITFLRHGESVGNADGYHQGQSEFELTETGREQAHTLAQRWQHEGRKFDYMIASPLSRAKQTAEIIAESLDLKLEFDPIWVERDNGILAGLKFEEGNTIHPRPDFVPLYFPTGETGESQWSLYLRAAEAVQSLMRQTPARYLVVSHGGLLNMVMHVVLGMAPQANFQGMNFRSTNTGFATFTYNPATSRWWVKSINDHQHLEIQQSSTGTHQIWLLRHGESEGNIKKVFQGQTDYQLTLEGKKQAHALALRWKREEESFDHIITSPLSRAHETAQIIADQLKSPLEVDPAWLEVDAGGLSGLNSAEIDSFPEHPDEISLFDPVGITGESWLELYLRAGKAMQRIISQPPGKYLIVSHGMVLGAALSGILGIQPQPHRHNPGFDLGNSSFAKVTYEPERNSWRFMRFGDQAHLQLKGRLVGDDSLK
ncbi:MAG: histidine phosphatase family protein [Chloroflexi bacterium]|nr:histidine phosphatase family protein [Chloroflexota bacterium]